MKLQNLERILGELRGQLEKLGECVRALSQELEVAKAGRDPFVTVLYAARKDYRCASANDNKSGRKSENSIRSSYLKAMEAGYQGSIREWEALLRVFKAVKNPVGFSGLDGFGEHGEEDRF